MIRYPLLCMNAATPWLARSGLSDSPTTAITFVARSNSRTSSGVAFSSGSSHISDIVVLHNRQQPRPGHYHPDDAAVPVEELWEVQSQERLQRRRRAVRQVGAGQRRHVGIIGALAV